MSQARIDNKGHAPCYQFLNSSFILQYRKAKINKNQRECYLQFSNEVYNDAKERLTKKGDAYRLIEGVDHIQYITNDQLKTIYLKW